MANYATSRTVAAMPATKIIATLGPASWTHDGIRALHDAGVDVFRINCSHSDSEAVGDLVRLVHKAAPGAAALVDLQGPKLRVGEFNGTLNANDVITLGPTGFVPVNFDPAQLGIEPGHRIMLDDGRILLDVLDVDGALVSVSVRSGGLLTPRKGVNLPDTVVRTSPLTEKDILDARAAVAAGCDWLALSFVQHPSDVVALRDLIENKARIIAKIERPQVLDHLDELCRTADAVMAARGDLGVELPFEQVPLIQHRIVDAALRHGTPSVCATEMLESMITSSRPTRAEANDVAVAVQAGFDAVMLSAETATGVNPLAAVSAMALLARTYEHVKVASPFANEHPEEAAVSAAAAALASRLSARYIISLTYTGYSAAMLAACRPPASVLAVSPSAQVCRQLQISHSVTTLQVERPDNIQVAASLALRAARDAGILEANERVVLCASRISHRSDPDTVWVAHAPE